MAGGAETVLKPVDTSPSVRIISQNVQKVELIGSMNTLTYIASSGITAYQEAKIER
jgi:hypothetical protein